MTTPNGFPRAGASDDVEPRLPEPRLSEPRLLESSPTALRAEIERTRERLGDTVEALGAQLNPSQLKQRVKDSVREATIGRVQLMASNTKERISETGRGLAQTIRDNPIPAAMAAAGLGWLLLSSRDQRTSRQFTNGEPDEFAIPDESYHATGIKAGVRNAADNVAGKAHDLSEKVAERAHDVSAKVTEKAQDLSEKAQDVTQRVVQKARATGDRVADTADVAVHRVQERARTTARRVENQFDESPMGIGAVALALGLAIGLSVPATRKEAALMGDKRDRLLDRARERVADTTEKVENIVERAMPEVQSVVREAARDEGLIR